MCELSAALAVEIAPPGPAIQRSAHLFLCSPVSDVTSLETVRTGFLFLA